MSKLSSFITESKEEFARVSWPSKKQAIISTILVIIVSIVFSFFFVGLDYIFAQLGTIVGK